MLPPPMPLTSEEPSTFTRMASLWTRRKRKKRAMIYSLVFVDLTTDATPDAMRPGTAFGRLIEALTEQLNRDYAAEYGEPTYEFRVACSPEDRQVGEIAINFRDTIPEAPGALAYHTVTNGVPDIELGVDLFQTLTDGQESLSCGLSHELLEMLGDAGANLWSDRQDGSGEMDARELCDFVQNSSYQASNGVHLSNFVLEAFFIPGSSGPWDFLGRMQSQHDVSHGYGILASSPTTTSQIGGKRILGVLQAEHAPRKKHAYCRAYRRGVRFLSGASYDPVHIVAIAVKAPGPAAVLHTPAPKRAPQDFAALGIRRR